MIFEGRREENDKRTEKSGKKNREQGHDSKDAVNQKEQERRLTDIVLTKRSSFYCTFNFVMSLTLSQLAHSLHAQRWTKEKRKMYTQEEHHTPYLQFTVQSSSPFLYHLHICN
jgi:hypothetical protein